MGNHKPVRTEGCHRHYAGLPDEMNVGKIKKLHRNINSGPSSTHIHCPFVAGNRWMAAQCPVSIRYVAKHPSDGPSVAMHVRIGSEGRIERTFNPSDPRTRGAQTVQAQPIAIE